MSKETKYNTIPSLEEILAAAQPGATVAERISIKERLQNTVSYDEAMNGVKEFLEDHNYDFDALNEFLSIPLKSTAKSTPTVSFAMIKKLSAAAIIIAVLAGVGWLLFSGPSKNKIISRSIFYEPGLPVFASVQGNKEFHELMSAYRMQESETGLQYYRSLVQKEPANDTLNYFGGWLYYMNRQHDSASIIFKNVISQPASIYIHKATFMQAICLYKTNQQIAAKAVFENIAKDKTHPYHVNASQLLENKRLW